MYSIDVNAIPQVARPRELGAGDSEFPKQLGLPAAD
jgi:hypothetical protein